MEILLALAAMAVAILALNKSTKLQAEIESLKLKLQYLMDLTYDEKTIPIVKPTKSLVKPITTNAVDETNGEVDIIPSANAQKDITIAGDRTASVPLQMSPMAGIHETQRQQENPKLEKAPTPQIPDAPPQKPKKSLEELIGAQWSVWIGGLVLFIGAVFLLRYTIESGIFTPPLRIIMALILGGVLIGTGHWLHTGDLKEERVAAAIEDRAYIPSLLVGIGIFTLFGSIYTAYGLYNLIGPGVAFTGLACVSIL
ncbi:MAG: DUF2339 domain-containing protein, partial [Maricaulaceae bacterium]